MQNPPESFDSGGSKSNPGQPRARAGRILGRGLLVGRHGRDRLQDLRSDLVWVALRVRTAVFQIALVAVVGEGVRNADRGTAIGNAVAELVPRRGLVLAGQTLVVVRAV